MHFPSVYFLAFQNRDIFLFAFRFHFFRGKQSLCKAYGRARDFERAHDRSGPWRAHGVDMGGRKEETADFVSNRPEFVVEEGPSAKRLGLRAGTKRFLVRKTMLLLLLLLLPLRLGCCCW